MAIGATGGPLGVTLGGVVGVAYGLRTCNQLAPGIKKKLFDDQARLSDEEVLSALHTIRAMKAGISKSAAMDRLAQIGQEVSRAPSNYRTARA